MAIYKGNQFIGVNAVKEKPIYVEVPEGSTIDDMSSENTIAISPEEYSDLQDAVNYRVGEFTQKSIPQMIAALKAKYFVDTNTQLRINEDIPTTWTRPQDWPDLDSLNLQMSGDTDFIYMTYATNRKMNNIALYFTGTGIQGEIGIISNGSFVSLEQLTITSSNYFYKSLDDYKNTYDYIVVHITGSSITRCRCVNYTIDGHTQAIKEQPILERIAYVPHIIQLSGDSNSQWGTYTLEREKINNGNGDALTYLGYAYDHCHKLKSLDISGLDTHNVTNMQNMFCYCLQLPGILDLRHFNVVKVTTFNSMFYECDQLLEINLTGWNPAALTGAGLNSMFYNCLSVKHIYGIENFNIQNCTQLSQVFYNCRNLQNLNLSNWNTNNVTTIAALFSQCFSIQDLSFVSNWRFNNLTNISSAFNNCRNIEKLDLHNWDVSNVTSVASTFNCCMNLKQLNIDGWSITKITSMSSVFYYCFSLEHINLSGWHITNKCTNVYAAFYNCASVQELNIPNDWDLTGITTGTYQLYQMFYGCWSLKQLTGISNWHFNATQSLASMFQNCYSLENLDISGWDVSKITNFSSMFNCCYSLRSLNVSLWDTSSGTTFASMFSGCFHLKTLDVSNFDVSNATTLTSMFSSCYSLKSVGNINNWNVSKVTTFASMFRYCHSLNQTFNLSTWNVSKVTNASYMFAECYSLLEFTANNWNLAVCTTVESMFYMAKNLKTLTLNNWCSNSTLPKLTTNPSYFAGYCYSLENYSGPKLHLNHSFTYDYSLTYESLIGIINNLPTVSSKTITISGIPYGQLTTDEKAIITTKGWTRN